MFQFYLDFGEYYQEYNLGKFKYVFVINLKKMINVRTINKNRISNGSLKDLQGHKFTLVDVLKPSPEEFKELAKYTQIPEQILKKSLGKNKRPVALDIGDYFQLSFKANIKKNKLKRLLKQIFILITQLIKTQISS